MRLTPSRNALKLASVLAVLGLLFWGASLLRHNASAIDVTSELNNAWGYAPVIDKAVALPSYQIRLASPKKVFAHYVPAHPISIDNKVASEDYYTKVFLNPHGEKDAYLGWGGMLRDRPLPRDPIVPASNYLVADAETDVRRAIASGIDGFTYDILSTDQNGTNMLLFNAMLPAVNAVNAADGTSFRVVINPDGSRFQYNPDTLLPFIEKYADDPAVYHLTDGRLVLTPFSADSLSATWWKQQIDAFSADKGYGIALVPVLQNLSLVGLQQVCATAHAASPPGICLADLAYGLSRWETGKAGDAALVKALNPNALWMSAICDQSLRLNSKVRNYTEGRGPGKFQDAWDAAIQNGAEWIQLVTWNDYGEGTEISPSMDLGYAFSDLIAYYSAWFKTGSAPAITRDALYYFHRTQSTTATGSLQTVPIPIYPGGDTPDNNIWLVGLLTEPATLSISIGGQTSSQDLPAGIVKMSVPLVEGVPQFSLVRDGVALGSFASSFIIDNHPQYTDLLTRAGNYLVPKVQVSATASDPAGAVPATIAVKGQGVDITKAVSPSTGTWSIQGLDSLSPVSDKQSYNVTVKPQGFLSQALHPSGILSSRIAVAAFVPGDFDGDDKVTLTDVVIAIRAYNNASDSASTVAKNAFSGTMTPGNLTEVIRNYNAAMPVPGR